MADYREIEQQLNAAGGIDAPRDEGLPWPPAADLPRLQRYDRYRRLYEGDHESVYIAGGRYRYDRDREYVTVNVCGEITDLLTDRLFGELIEVRVAAAAASSTLQAASNGDDRTPAGSAGGDVAPPLQTARLNGGAAQEWLDHLVEASAFDTMLIELGRGVSYRGDGALKVRYDADQRDVLIGYVPSSILFLEVAEGDVTTIRSATIGYLRGELLFQEIHTRGRISYRLYRTHRGADGIVRYRPTRDRVPLDTLEDLAGLEDEQETGVDALLIVPIALGGTDESGVWGRSDYADIDAMQGELNNRVTQIAGIQDKHSDPWMYGPPMFLNEQQQLDPRYKYFGVDRQEQAPGYITWEAQLEHAEQAIERLKRDMWLTAGLSPESFGIGETGGAESGRALKLRQHRTASAVRMRQRVYDRALRRAISLASKLANSPVAVGLRLRPPILEPGDIIIGWQDGLPADETENVERAGTGLTMGVLSLEHAVRMAQPELTDAEVEAEIARIKDVQAARPRLNFAPQVEPIAAAARPLPEETGVNVTTE